jgi:hypothetical protein
VGLALTASVVLAAGACSSGGDDAASTSSTTTTTAASSTTTEPADDTTTTAAEPSDDEAQARAEAALVALDDFTDPGWTASPRSTTQNVLDTCLPASITEQISARANSDNFELEESGGTLTIASGSGVFAERSAARDVIDQLATEELAACATTETKQRLTDVTVEGAFQPTDPLPDLGDEAIGFGADFDLTETASGATHHVSVLAIAIRTDDMVSTVTMTGVDHDLDEPLLYQLLDLIVERQAA